MIAKMTSKMYLLFLILSLFSCVNSGENTKTPDETKFPYLLSSVWYTHLTDDLLPFWTDTNALCPNNEGNFTQNRDFSGAVISSNTNRRPRMLSRQTFLYAISYLMTGDEKLLELAHKGSEYIINNAWDSQYGGYHAELDINGNPVSDNTDKTAQDISYGTQGPAAYYFVSRNKNAQDIVLKTRDLIFSTFWDETNDRVIDGFDVTLSKEYDAIHPGYDLVSILDPVNAYMTLVQPVLTEEQRRTQFLKDLGVFSDAMIKHFYKDKIFWGSVGDINRFTRNHNDFGHTLKSYWMILRTVSRAGNETLNNQIKDNVHDIINLAYIDNEKRWANTFTSLTQPASQWGNSWWIWSEEDQITATLNMADGRYTEILSNTAKHWFNFVDKTNKEVYSDIGTNGTPSNTSGWKTSEWKNGFHSVEHALIMYIHGCHFEKKTLSLYFAVPQTDVNTFIAKPYIFEGTEISRTDCGAITIGGTELHKVRVDYEGASIR